MNTDFKNKYLKYKLKYLELKGGNIIVNKENFKDLRDKYIEIQKKKFKKT